MEIDAETKLLHHVKQLTFLFNYFSETLPKKSSHRKQSSSIEKYPSMLNYDDLKMRCSITGGSVTAKEWELGFLFI